LGIKAARLPRRSAAKAGGLLLWTQILQTMIKMLRFGARASPQFVP
jgi:hypothetical protein